MNLFGSYDVVVTGAGSSGIVAAIRAAREGAKVLLLEGTGFLGGLITGGRLTKPTGLINSAIFHEMLDRCVGYRGADGRVRESYWGKYTGTFDAETMQRVIIEMVEESGVEVLLRATVTETVVKDNAVHGLVIRTKSGESLVLAKAFVDASGDGDVAALAGAKFMLGRQGDGLTQPITSYFRLLNVNVPALIADCEKHRDDMWEVVYPKEAGDNNEDYVMAVLLTGFQQRIKDKVAEGFDWIVPKDHITMKTGLIPGEISVNVTRFQGNGLDDRDLSQAEIEIRKQAYCAYDFLQRFVGGFENAIFLEVAPKLGIRETRRVVGHYVLTEDDVRGNKRFDDAIGLCNSPVDVHEPGGSNAIMDHIGIGYGIPFRTMVPLELDNIIMAGRCISSDEIAFGSTRNVPACTMTGEAAAVAAALAAARGVPISKIEAADVQARLRELGVWLGTPDEDVPEVLQANG
ncbi:FAD-dependent oxidoreductase [Nitratireductor kimnyeongensis]|uniref:FAD-dependent oxidoreductase n=1 Tax=Nitratireductor kimnyeongensis TaxID=430679 RepID=A0ABW0TE64_9HYPH|nr:FAD-dependent oxidoreductase [Nitratireductor kimnyeongensis]QZZ36962.1 FAD-dependent oxidoreductase [Nitratireductor kimnyeongensis]